MLKALLKELFNCGGRKSRSHDHDFTGMIYLTGRDYVFICVYISFKKCIYLHAALMFLTDQIRRKS